MVVETPLTFVTYAYDSIRSFKLSEALGCAASEYAGRANQRIAERADEVVLLVAGLPWKLK